MKLGWALRVLVIGTAMTGALAGVACRNRPQAAAIDSGVEAVPTIPYPEPGPTEWRVEEAIAAAKEAVASDLSSASAWGHLGAVYDAHSYFPEAARCYRQALQLAPESFRWNYHLAITLDREAEDLEEVVRLFTRAAQLEPRYPPVPYRLGAALYRNARYYEAREAFEQALELDPRLAIARRHLGQTLMALGETDSALAHLEEAAVQNPRDGAAHSALAQLYTRLGRTDRARASAESARRSSPDLAIPDPIRFEVTSLGVSGYLAYKRGQAALDAGRLEEAIALFEIKDEVNPSTSNDYYLGVSHRKAGRPDKAIEYFERAITRSDHANSHWQLGELLIESGHADAGLDQLRLARNSGSDDAQLLHGVGADLARHGQLEDAIEAFAAAQRLDSQNSSLEADWCGALMQLGRLTESLEHCRSAVQLDDSSARAHFHLGLVLESSNRAAEARRHYERAVQLDPTSRARERLAQSGG
jgi:tetratricopeptide (TPR) repeat protein